jgi:nucleotide-binding universal stress UspA family protein
MITVLVGVDASEHSRDAIAFAGTMARASGARVVVACAFNGNGRDDLRFALRDEAEFIARRMSRHLHGIDVGRVHARAHPTTASDHGLSELAASEGAALVIVGASRPDVSGATSPGGTGARLLHEGACPVAVVPRGYLAGADRPFRRIGVGYDGTPESRSALVAAVAAVHAFGAELTVITVLSAQSIIGASLPPSGPGYFDFDDDFRSHAHEQLDAVVASLPLGAEGMVLNGRPAHQLALRSKRLDLLIVGSRGYNALHAALGGGVSGQVLRDAHCPVIAVPPGIDAPLAFLSSGRPRQAQSRG